MSSDCNVVSRRSIGDDEAMNPPPDRSHGKLSSHTFLAALTVVTILIQGYHPYAEDGGVYIAGIKRLLNPALYPYFTEFVLEHTRFSLFAPAMAGLTRGLHISLPTLLLVIYTGSTWLLLHGGWQIASRCLPTQRSRIGAVCLLSVWCGLPVAGTSLMIMDPYVTARSLTTPLALLAIAMALDLRHPGRCKRALFCCLACLCIAACLHPLMAAYTAGFIVLLCCAQSNSLPVRRWAPLCLGLAALGLAAFLQIEALPDSAAYTAVAFTRYYWFPGEWHWYELFGLFAPLLIVAAINQLPGKSLRLSHEAGALCRATISLGIITMAVAFLFSRESASTHLVARLQPLRCFQMVYLIMLLLLGGIAGELWKRGKVPWAFAAFVVLAGGMSFVQQQPYSSSHHLEMTWQAPRNPWVQAFLWVRQNTPTDVLFALDANYITTDGEDAQCFRAIAERSALPDFSKDGGEASITPGLTAAWTVGSKVQAGLSSQTDAERSERLLPLGVSWIVLKASTDTNLGCPYRNETVKVCRLR